MKTAIRFLGVTLMVSTMLFGCSNDELNSGTNPEGVIATPRPSGLDIQYLDPGATLAEVNVVGQNIKWYYHNPTDFSLQSKTDSNTELDYDDLGFLPQNTLLPITLKVKNEGTYYATQTINSVESVEGLRVTTFLEGG